MKITIEGKKEDISHFFESIIGARYLPPSTSFADVAEANRRAVQQAIHDSGEE